MKFLNLNDLKETGNSILAAIKPTRLINWLSDKRKDILIRRDEKILRNHQKRKLQNLRHKYEEDQKIIKITDAQKSHDPSPFKNYNTRRLSPKAQKQYDESRMIRQEQEKKLTADRPHKDEEDLMEVLSEHKPKSVWDFF